MNLDSIVGSSHSSSLSCTIFFFSFLDCLRSGGTTEELVVKFILELVPSISSSALLGSLDAFFAPLGP